jgi:agmatine/peptidylarginine deiminase
MKMKKSVIFAVAITIGISFASIVYANNEGEIGKDFQIDAPPAPVRQPAEFEPMQGVLIRYPFGISYDIIAEMAEDVEVVTIVANSDEQNYVESQYQNHGINLSHCSFLIAPTDTYWTRDYGPWFIFNGDDEQGIVNFTYNRPRPNDDKIPEAYGDDQGIPVYQMDLVHTGGNYMTDGQGIAVSTELVWEENPDLTHDEINQTVADYLGIDTYHVVPDVLGEYIKHIDCWAKYLAPDKIMIIEVPESHSQYDEIEAAVDYFENQTSCYGTPYKIERVYTHYGEPYINSLILNDKVLVPITGSEWDDDAIASYQAAMLGYEVLGFTGSWQTTDALHCRTMGITDRYMLYIKHIPLTDGEASNDGFLVEAKIIPYSGENLTDSLVYWKTDGEWNSIQMGSIGNNSFDAYIPPQPNGTVIHYYIHAEDNSGRSENHPYIGDLGAHSFTVHMICPEIMDVLVNPSNQISGGYVNISANVTDNVEVDEVYLNITYPNGSNVNFSIKQNITGDTYYCNKTYINVGTYNYFIWANDTSGNENASDVYQFEIISPMVDYILITDSPGGIEIPDRTVATGFTTTGYASAYNDTVGYIGLINVSWSVDNVDSNAWTSPSTGDRSTFNAGSYLGTATWTVDDGDGHSDTVVFEIVDTTPPEITDVMATPSSQTEGRYVNITCTVTDNVEIDEVKVNITGPDGFTPMNVTMNMVVGTDDYYYNETYDIAGKYDFFIWSDDTSGNENTSATHTFTILSAEPTLCTNPDPPSNDFGNVLQGETSSWSFNVWNGGGGILEWNISDDREWISVYPMNGTDSGTVEVTVNTIGLDEGYHSGHIYINSTGGNKTGFIEVNVTPYPSITYITTLKEHWNLFSLPFNQTIILSQLYFIHNGVGYSWEEATSQNIIYGVIYDWNRTEQRYHYLYSPTDILNPGYGYWIICKVSECELYCNISNPSSSEGYITTLLKHWNLFGLPFNDSITIGQLKVIYDDEEYNWTEAVDEHIIYGVIYDWNRTDQRYKYYYDSTDSIYLGYGYWIICLVQECEVWYA